MRKISLIHRTAIAVLAVLITSVSAQAFSYSFGDTLQPGGIVLANGATMSGELIKIGNGEFNTPHHGENTGDDPAQIGGEYNGIVFDPSADADPDPTLATRISASPRHSVGLGFEKQHRHAIGIYINFSVPTMLQDFYVFDLDGDKENNGDGNTEWAASFAFNGDTLLHPDFAIATDSDLVLSDQAIHATGLDAHANWQDLVNAQQGVSGTRQELPYSLDMAVNMSENENHKDPDDPYIQLLVDYNTEITDLYVLWGIQRDVSTSSQWPQQSSGLTGFSSPVDRAVPDAGATVALLGLALLPLAAIRRK